MSAKIDLIVIGTQLPLDNRFAPCLTIRKIFNAKNMKSENKFAQGTSIINMEKNNHKLIRLKSNKNRSVPNLYVRCMNRTIMKDLNGNKRRIKLPIHLHYFPRFASIYTPRGRQTLCESRPPDETYNDTIRSIRAANTCKQLEGLVQRCLAWKVPELRRINSKPNTTSSGSSRIKNIHDDLSTCHFMQLAAEYYERGFLHNIKYLESIAERYNITKANIVLRTKGEQRQREIGYRKEALEKIQIQTQTSRATAYSISSSNSRSVSAQSSTSTATTLNEEEQITKRNFVAAAAAFSSILTRSQSIRATDNTQPTNNHNNNWNAIRVQITPIFKFNYTKNSIIKSNNNQYNNIIYNNQSKHNNNPNYYLNQFNNEKSMNDYLNANYMNNCDLNNIQIQQQQTRKLEEEHQHLHQHEHQQQHHQINNNEQHSALSLLADLANLEIKSEADLHLPKITLTDCCTHQPIDTSEETREIGAFILKQSKLHLNRYNSLELPDEQNYHSESRPP